MMEQNVCLTKSGFTLIEFLVAIVILMVGMLALLQTVNIAMKHNITNQLRNEAVMIADGRMALEMVRSFNSISTNSSSTFVGRNVNLAFNNFSITRTGTAVSGSTKNVEILVSWKYKGTRNTHSVSSLISASSQ